VIFIALAMGSCKSSRSSLKDIDFKALAKAGIKLGFDIDFNDNHRLMTTSADWIGVPYKYGGNTRSGIDCSGLVKQIYKQVYGINLSRISRDQLKDNCRRISKNSLRQGDLVFFAPEGSDVPNHVGIYLKNGAFIHSSSKRGVIVSYLNEKYYSRHWLTGGAVVR